MSVLRIDTDRYEESAGWAAAAGHGLAEAVRSAGVVLAHTGGMAGWDHMGSEWAAAYDPAARDVFDACQALALASSDTARALTFSAGNYIAAEHVASMGVAPFIEPLVPHSVPERSSPWLPSACEQTPKWVPEGWDIIEGLSGVVWPTGDPGLLRSAGSAWIALADDVDAAINGPSHAARNTVDGLLSADLTLFRARSGALGDAGSVISESSRDISGKCELLASAVESAHQDLRDETALFVAECAGLAAVGLTLSFVTLGGSAAITTLVGAARAAQMILRVQQVVARLAATARSVAIVVNRLPDAVRLKSALQILARTPATFHTAAGATARFLSAAPGASAIASGLAPAVRVIRPIVTGGVRFLDSRAVSIALSGPAEVVGNQIAWHVRKRVLGANAVKGDVGDQILELVGRPGLIGLKGVAAASFVRRAMKAQDRAEAFTQITALPASLQNRYAPGSVGALAAGAAGPGRLTAVRVPPTYDPTLEPTRDRRTSRPGASP